MLTLDSELDFFKTLAVILYSKYFYPIGTIPMSPELMVTLIIVLITLIPFSLPLLYYAFKLKGFVQYSKMWQPWKKLALGWFLLVVGAVSGLLVFVFLLMSGMVNQPFISVVFLLLMMSPLLVFMGLTMALTYIGIKDFYKNAKEVVQAS
ncbi:MAG: hypothetical protein ACFFCM_06620 [Promethearchaeota archaeon]